VDDRYSQFLDDLAALLVRLGVGVEGVRLLQRPQRDEVVMHRDVRFARYPDPETEQAVHRRPDAPCLAVLERDEPLALPPLHGLEDAPDGGDEGDGIPEYARGQFVAESPLGPQCKDLHLLTMAAISMSDSLAALSQ